MMRRRLMMEVHWAANGYFARTECVVAFPQHELDKASALCGMIFETIGWTREQVCLPSSIQACLHFPSDERTSNMAALR